LARREIVRFLRQRSRIVGALGTPLVFWVLIGSGLGRSFRLQGAEQAGNYLEYFFPGTVALVVMFTAIFCMISVIEDRREGFLQGVMASPARRSAIVFGKVLGCSVLAVVQGVLFLLLAPLIGVPLTLTGLASAIGMLTLMAFGLSGLGLLMAWPLESSQGFHAVMNLVLMPMWFLSGSLFPVSGSASWVAWVVRFNPLTYGVAGIRRSLFGGAAAADLPSMGMALGVSFAFVVIMLVLATRVVCRRG
jgi:ABC-2 type transport system permease protein